MLYRYEVRFISQIGVPIKTFIISSDKFTAREKFENSKIPYISITNIAVYNTEHFPIERMKNQEVNNVYKNSDGEVVK